MSTVPNPGSKEAREQGCLCPIIDNEHGKGYLGNGEQFGFVINEYTKFINHSWSAWPE